MYISIKNQSQLLGIPRNDIIEMMLSGLNFFDSSITSFVSKIDGFEQEIMFDEESLNDLSSTLDKDDFILKIDGSLLEITSKKTPPSLFFVLEGWKKALEDSNLYSPLMFLLVPHRSNGTLFIGEFSIINRLSQDFDGEYDIISIKDLQER